MIIAYNAVCALVGYLLLTKPLSDVLPWFSEAPKFALAGWNFWDYVKLSLLLQGTISLCIELLFYDRTSKRNIQETQKRGFVKQVVYVMLTVTILFGLFYLFGFLIHSPPYRIVVLSILLSFSIKTESGSAMSRVFLLGLPSTYIGLCPLLALGFGQAFVYALVWEAITWPETVLRTRDD